MSRCLASDTATRQECARFNGPSRALLSNRTKSVDHPPPMPPCPDRSVTPPHRDRRDLAGSISVSFPRPLQKWQAPDAGAGVQKTRSSSTPLCVALWVQRPLRLRALFPQLLCLWSHLIALIRCFGPQRPTGEPVGWHIVRLVRINPSACACAPRTAAKLRSKLGMQRDTVVICRISWRNYFSIWGFALAP